MPRSGKKGGGKNTLGPRASDVTLDDFANCRVSAGRLRKSTSNSFVRDAKKCSSYEETIRNQDDDEEEAERAGPDPLPTTNNQIILEETASFLKVESGEPKAQCQLETITLTKDIPQGSVGITLAGGADYEVKEITIHKVITGGLADRDGRLQKGDRILSINGQALQGLTHRQALDLLKAHQYEIVLVIGKDSAIQNCFDVQTKSSLSGSPDKVRNSSQCTTRETKGANTLVQTPSGLKNQEDVQLPPGAVKLHLLKDGTGLGFSLEGGQGSPLGDRPLTVKRVFKGGAADQEGHLTVGDQVLFIGNQSVSSMTRTEAWNYMKKFPEGPVTLTVRPLSNNTLPN